MNVEENLEIVFQELRRNKQSFVICTQRESNSTAFPECLLWVTMTYNCIAAGKCVCLVILLGKFTLKMYDM